MKEQQITDAITKIAKADQKIIQQLEDGLVKEKIMEIREMPQ
jgi:hypothetical protein